MFILDNPITSFSSYLAKTFVINSRHLEKTENIELMISRKVQRTRIIYIHTQYVHSRPSRINDKKISQKL